MKGERGTIDRRVARTRGILHQALMTLMRSKDYEAITIKDICDTANVGRSTFYAHYTNKEDLHRSGLEHLRNMLIARQKAALARPTSSGHRNFAFSLAMFEHTRDHLDLYRALIGGHGGAIALETLRAILSELVRHEIAASRKAKEAAPRELIVQFVIGAYMAVLIWWLDGGAKLPAERVDAMFRRLAMEGVARVPGFS